MRSGKRNDSFEVYSGGGYVLGIEDGILYARIGGETYKLCADE